jgi:putative transcriptional regulator
MVQSRLSRLMGEKRVRLIDVARATRISRNMLAKLYYDRAKRIDLGDLAKLCEYFGCTVGDLLESVPDPAHREKKGKARHT